MSRAPADYREFIRVSVDLPANPKLALIDDPAAGWAYVVSLCYCGQHLTDGSFPMAPLLRLAGVKRAVAKALVDAGLWHETGHDCDRCPQPMKGMAVVHDYLVHQRSADEAKALRDARREAGRKGAATRWSSNGDGKSHSNGHCKSHANGYSNSDGNGVADDVATSEQGLWPSDGKPMPEVEVEEEELQKKTSSSSPRATRKKPEIRLPASWQPTPEHRAYAAEHGLELDTQRQLFTAHAEAHDRRCASWNGAFAQWLIKADERARSRASQRPPLRAVSGGHVPYRNPDQSEYDDPGYWGTP